MPEFRFRTAGALELLAVWMDNGWQAMDSAAAAVTGILAHIGEIAREIPSAAD